MKFSYQWLQKLVGFSDSPQKIAELLTLRVCEVEAVEKVGRDWAIDVKIPANRISDTAHHWGLAQEIAAAMGKKFFLRSGKKIGRARASIKAPTISLANTELSPRYTAIPALIRSVGVSPSWMAERLGTCGFRPVNAVVDVTNYVMLEMGVPLHAFDLGKIRGGKMHVREARSGETLRTLDGTDHRLPQGAIIIEDGERLIDLAGIMGGENSAVSPGTKEILLQAAVFDPVRVYRATRALNFSSAASKIYAAGIGASRTREALERALELLSQAGVLAGYGAFIDLYSKKEREREVLFRPAYANRLIGVSIPEHFYKQAFAALGFRVARGKAGWVVRVPAARRDLTREEDLIEDAVRLYGYEKIPAAMPDGGYPPGETNEEIAFSFTVREFLAGKGFTESLLHQFLSRRDIDALMLSPNRALELENPLNPETAYLTPRLLGNYILSAAENIRIADEVRLFGIGKSFRRVLGAEPSGVDEHTDIVFAFSRRGARGETEFYELKGVLDGLLEAVGIRDHWYDDAIGLSERMREEGLFHPYRVATIKADDDMIGTIGEIHPAISEAIKARARIVAAEIDFAALFRHARDEAEFRGVPKYPSVIRDISVVLPDDVRVDDVLEVIEDAGGTNLIDVDLFDYFVDDGMREEGKRSMAFHLVFRAEDRTLTDNEVDKNIQKVFRALENNHWEVRS